MVDVHVSPDALTASSEATKAVADALSKHKDTPVLFLVSGGSSLTLLNTLPVELFDAHVTIGVLDERFSTDPAINNFAQLSKTDFFKNATTRGASVIDTTTKDGELIEEAAKNFETELKNWRMSHADGVIIIIQGIGPDGHTAGIMPYPDDKRTHQFYFDDSEVWAMGYDCGFRNKYPLRVTVTLTFLRKVTTSIVYAVGAEKKAALEAILAPEGEVHKTPGRIISQMHECHLYTDQQVGTVT